MDPPQVCAWHDMKLPFGDVSYAVKPESEIYPNRTTFGVLVSQPSGAIFGKQWKCVIQDGDFPMRAWPLVLVFCSTSRLPMTITSLLYIPLHQELSCLPHFLN